MIDRSGHSESTHFMSHDRVLHLKPELLDAAAEILPQLQHVEIELRTSVWGEILMTHLTTTYKDNMIWIHKHNLSTSFWHFFSRGH
jgi:hypothetical protein